ncbi:SLBB domain-containing protein, partial [Lactococcus lactis]
ENLSSVSRQSSVSKFSEPNEKSVSKIMVDLKGAVTKPNVYQISSDERLVDLIKEAGGFTDRFFIRFTKFTDRALPADRT